MVDGLPRACRSVGKQYFSQSGVDLRFQCVWARYAFRSVNCRLLRIPKADFHFLPSKHVSTYGGSNGSNHTSQKNLGKKICAGQGRVNRPKPRKMSIFRKSQIEVLCSFSDSLSTRIVFAVKNHAESYVQGVRICIIRGDHVFRVRVGFRGKRLICDLYIAFADRIKPWSCETWLYKPSARKPWLTVYRAHAVSEAALYVVIMFLRSGGVSG